MWPCIHDSTGTGRAGHALGIMAETRTPSEPLILVVEDEVLLRLYAADFLEEHGFRVIEAPNADAALKVLESRDDVRLLFTDIQMPGTLDGMDLAREVHQRWPRVLLVITSGQKKPAEIPDEGRFVAKPYRADDLLSQMDDMIHKD
jgi:CheY-like chemotaxis protein